MTSLIKPPKSFWVIGVLALLWNLMGISQFFLATFMLDAMVENLTEVQADMYRAIPLWYTIIFAIAVFSGVLGCITMLLRKNITIALFGISLLAVLVAQGYWILGTEIMEVMGTSSVIMPLIVIVISIFLYFYNKGAAKNGWFK
ncbi:MAG TPA: hypothetical protein VFD35_12820 [Pricia sp.]|nr:hypothetical protein [Pricia sp.]